MSTHQAGYTKRMCPNCGHEIISEQFCTACGYGGKMTHIPALKSTQTITKRSCPNCGAVFTKGEKFCGIDGALIIEQKEESIVSYRKIA